MNQPQAGAKMLLVSGSRIVFWRSDSTTNDRLAGKARAANITLPTHIPSANKYTTTLHVQLA